MHDAVGSWTLLLPDDPKRISLNFNSTEKIGQAVVRLDYLIEDSMVPTWDPYNIHPLMFHPWGRLVGDPTLLEDPSCSDIDLEPTT